MCVYNVPRIHSSLGATWCGCWPQTARGRRCSGTRRCWCARPGTRSAWRHAAGRILATMQLRLPTDFVHALGHSLFPALLPYIPRPTTTRTVSAPLRPLVAPHLTPGPRAWWSRVRRLHFCYCSCTRTPCTRAPSHARSYLQHGAVQQTDQGFQLHCKHAVKLHTMRKCWMYVCPPP